MASQPSRPRRNVSPASSSKPQPLRAVHPFSLLRNPSPTRGNPIRRSPSSSPVHNLENAFKPRRNSPETRGSPEHRRSPTSPSLASLKVEKPKPLRAGGIRRTSSLDAISGNYLSGQWPRDGGRDCAPCCHKATQTPAWDESKSDESSPVRHKRSNSLGSADLREKLKQHLQRKKQEKKSTVAYGRQSPVHGDHSAIQHKTTQSLAIPIPVITRPTEIPPRRSVEALNSEIQTLVLKSNGISSDKVLEPIDGRKAPVQEMLSDNSPFNTVDTQTQTPSENIESQDSSGNSSSRSHSASPTYPIMAGSADYQSNSRSSSSGGVQNDPVINDVDGQESGGSPDPTGIPKYASSPKPNNSYLFARLPPDGAEKVPLHVEDYDSEVVPQLYGPDKTKVKFILSNVSAFNPLPSFPAMAIKPVGLLNTHTSVEASQ